MAKRGETTATRRLFPRRQVAWMHGLCSFLFVVFGVMTIVEPAPVRPVAAGMSLAALMLWGAVIRSTRPRRAGPVAPRADGSVVVESPAFLVALLLGAWAAVLAALVTWVVLAFTNPAAWEIRRWVVTVVVGGLGSVPDLVRLLTGRLHRWRLVADDDGIRYRGYRTDRALAWSEISSIRAEQKPPGVCVRVKGQLTPIVAPALAFDLSPDVIAKALLARRTGRSRRSS